MSEIISRLTLQTKDFVSFDFANNEEYEFENFKSVRDFNREISIWIPFGCRR